MVVKKVRCLLSMVMLQRRNVLLLDEPTNHLDLEAIEALQEALVEFPGTIVFVSHDRQFVDAVATRVLVMGADNIEDWRGNYSDYPRCPRPELVYSRFALEIPGFLYAACLFTTEPQRRLRLTQRSHRGSWVALLMFGVAWYWWVVAAVLVLGLVLYVAAAAFLWSQQDKIIFHPTVGLTASPLDEGAEFEDFTAITSDGESIHGWWVPHPQATATVIFCHGNAGAIDLRLDYVRFYQRLKVNLVLWDYRGYGNSTGIPSEAGMYRDAAAVWQYAQDSWGLQPATTILHGRSMGGGVSSWLATQDRLPG